MATRYVWNKYNVLSEYELSETVKWSKDNAKVVNFYEGAHAGGYFRKDATTSSEEIWLYGPPFDVGSTVRFYFGTGYTFDKSTGLFSLTNYVYGDVVVGGSSITTDYLSFDEDWSTASTLYFFATTPESGNSAPSIVKTVPYIAATKGPTQKQLRFYILAQSEGKYITVNANSNGYSNTNARPVGASGGIKVLSYNLSYSQGSTNYGKISASANGAYPTDGKSGSYWYTYQGSDVIDPTAVGYSTTVPKGGEAITINVTARSNTYGGTIKYKYQHSIDGGSTWTDIATTSATSQSVTVPKGAPSFKARVLASDNYGFTSTDYVVGSSLSVSNNEAPGTPPSITVPETVQGGSSLAISWEAATDADGNLSGYELERSVDGGSWTQVYKGANTSYSDSITKGWQTVAYRVRAYDSESAYSSYKTSATRTVTNNSAPVISGSDSSLGAFTTSPPSAIGYTVTDADGDAVTVTIALDGVTVYTHTPTLGQAYSYAIDASKWMQVLNGNHTIKITADDGNGGTAVRTYTFSKSVTSLSFTLSTPLIADDMVTKALESLVATIPVGANVTIEVCNNGFDASPTWEDVTARVLAGEKIFLQNTAKTADSWGYNFRMTVDRNGATGDCYVKGVSGFFE